MRFGDVVMAVASLVVIDILFVVPLDMVLVLALGFYWGTNVSGVVSILLAALVVGYIFAGKIWEARREAISKITVLTAALVMLFVMHFPALAGWSPSVEEEFREMLGTATLSTFEWLGVEMMVLSLNMFVNVVGTLVLGFIGLYVGSMFRRPVKS